VGPVVVDEETVGSTDKGGQALTAGVIPGARVGRRRRKPDLPRFVSLPDQLELGDPIQDHAIEPGQLFSRARAMVGRGMRG
jgi:hypothetical protein